MTKTLDAARDMAARGFRVFPLAAGSKVPLRDYHWRTESAPPYEQWHEDCNYAIDCGRSDLVVIDIDMPDGGSSFEHITNGEIVPETFTVRTPSGGKHLYFRGNLRGGRPGMLAANIDVKGEGGYIVGPASAVGSKSYEVIDAAPVAELPGWLAGLIVSNLAESDYGKGWAGKSLDELEAELAGASEGERNDCLNRVAFVAFCNPRINDGEARERLADVALGAGLSASEVQATVDSAYSASTRERGSKGRREASTGSAGRLALTPLSAISFRSVRWAWDTTSEGDYPGSGGRFPIGTICIGAGRPGAGKGQFAAWLGARVSTGTLPGCFYGKPRGIIIYTTEDSHAMTIGPRFKAAGADLDRVFIFARPSDQIGTFAMMKIREDLRALRTLIDEYDIGLIILDPLISVLDGKTDINSETGVRSELEPFQAMLEETGCFAFGIMHFRKMRDEDILNMFSGSGAFARVVRAAVAFGAEKDDDGNLTRVLSTVKNNLGRTDLPSYIYDFESSIIRTDDGPSTVSRLVFKGESAWSVEDIHEGKNNSEAAKTAIGQAEYWLAGKLSDGPTLVDDIRKAHGDEGCSFSWSTVERAKKRLDAQTRKDGFGGKSSWSLTTSDEIEEIDEYDEIDDPFSSSRPHSRQYHQKFYPREYDEHDEIGDSHTRQVAPISSMETTGIGDGESAAIAAALIKYPALATV